MIVGSLWHLFYVLSKDPGENSFSDYGRVGMTGVFAVLVKRIESTKTNGVGCLSFWLYSNFL